MSAILKSWGCLSVGMAALSFSATLTAAAPGPLLEARLQIFRPDCSTASVEEVQAAVLGASQVLESRCHLRLRTLGVQGLALAGPWCHLPMEIRGQTKTLQSLAAAAKAQQPRNLALFLVPTAVDSRISWSLVDSSLRSACNSPQEARFLKRFGSIFFTDLSWMQGAPKAGDSGPSLASLLLAHEVLHSLTQRAHPTGAERASVMADHIADMGPAITDDWCECARRSPYASALSAAVRTTRKP